MAGGRVDEADGNAVPGDDSGAPANAGSDEAGEGKGALARVLGPRMMLLLVLGDVLGAGVYALTGRVAGEIGGAIWLPFLVAFALAFLTATAYVELVGKYPQAAGAALYAHKAFGSRFLTFMVAFAVMASGITSAATAARAFGGDYLAEFFSAPVVVVAVLFILLTAVINLRGIQESARTNLVLTLVELTGLLIIVGIGIYALLTGEGEPGRAVEFDTDGALPLAVLAGSALAFYALLGFEDSVNLVEECKSPQRAYPRALFGGLAIAGAIYLLVAFTATMVVETDVLTESSGPLLEVVKGAGVSFPPKLFAVIALVAVSNTALINMVMASRLVYGMANQGIVPKAFGTVHSKRHTPLVAIAFTTLIALILVSTGDVSGLADTTVLLLLVVFFVVNVSVLVLRREPGPEGSYRAPTWAPVVGAVASLVLASPLTGREGSVYLRALVLLAVGVALYVVTRVLGGRGGETHETSDVPQGDATASPSPSA